MKKHHIKNCSLKQSWRSLLACDIEFHESVNIFVGVNSSGKTSLLDLIAANTRLSVGSGSSDKAPENELATFDNICPFQPTDNKISIRENKGSGFVGGKYEKSGEDYRVVIKTLHFTANRGVSAEPVFNKGVRPLYTIADIYETISTNQRFRSSKWNTFIERVLLSWILAATPTSQFVDNDDELSDLYKSYVEEFIGKLIEFFPKYLGFENILMSNNEIVFKISGENIPLAKLSSGIGVLLEYVFGIFIFEKVNGESNRHKGYCVIIDEIENHIHPSLERELLPRLSKAFPSAQFFVATHSPIVASSVKESKIFIMERTDNGEALKFMPKEHDMSSSIDSVTSTLFDVIGIPSLLPFWLEGEYEKIYRRTENPSRPKHLEKFLDECEKSSVGIWAHMYWSKKMSQNSSD